MAPRVLSVLLVALYVTIGVQSARLRIGASARVLQEKVPSKALGSATNASEQGAGIEILSLASGSESSDNRIAPSFLQLGAGQQNPSNCIEPCKATFPSRPHGSTRGRPFDDFNSKSLFGIDSINIRHGN